MRVRESVVPLTLAALLGAAGCDGLSISTVPVDDRPLAEAQAALYREDAARLALRHVALTTDLADAPAEIPEALQQTLYNALVRVYNADHDARDHIANIHTWPDPELSSLLVRFDGTAEWADVWQRGETLTGDARIDELLERYDLVVEKFYDWSIGNYVVLRGTGELFNMARVAREFAQISGILTASPNSTCCDGDDITAKPADDGWLLTYRAKWGDCPAGCIEEHWWRFIVRPNGSVLFVGSGGSDFPRTW